MSLNDVEKGDTEWEDEEAKTKEDRDDVESGGAEKGK